MWEESTHMGGEKKSACLDEGDVEERREVVDKVKDGELLEEGAVVVEDGLVVFKARQGLRDGLVRDAKHRDLDRGQHEGKGLAYIFG